MGGAAFPVTASALAKLMKLGTDASISMIEMFHQMVDLAIPWTTFNEAMAGLKQSKKQYSDKAAEIVGEIQRLLLDSTDNYSSSREAVSRWCKMAINVLPKYLALFEKTSSIGIAEAQKILLLEVLNQGAIQMDDAIKKLEASCAAFNHAYGNLTKLKTQFDIDFSQESSYFKASVKKVRAEAYGGAAAGAVGIAAGPIGLAIGLILSYGTAAAVVEGKLIPKMKKAFEETRKQFDELLSTVQKSKDTIQSAKAAIAKEVKDVGEMAAQINSTKAFAEAWSQAPAELFDPLKDSTTNLMNLCQGYISSTANLK